jgi:3',5'-cyclic AMP phosphodiesterase CpdA
MIRSRRKLTLTIPFLASGLFSAGSMLIGCSATTPAFNTPQMTPAPLAARSNSRTSKSDEAARANAEAKLPELEKVTTPPNLFTVSPYLQWGKGMSGKTASVALYWETPNASQDATPDSWIIETRQGAAGTWQKITTAPVLKPLAVPGVTPQMLWSATLDGLTPSDLFDYRVSTAGKPVFIGRARAPKEATLPYRFVVFGDCSAGTPAQKKIAYQTYRAKPDFVFITGDIVYDRGLASEYLSKFFPIYNADNADPKVGAPLLRSTLLLAAIGNHDGDYSDFEKWPDALAYFYYWNLPLTGPELSSGGPNTPKVKADNDAEKAMEMASGGQFPRIENYSFDYGNSHWTVLDSNTYTNWNSKELLKWLENDLTSAQKAKWRFVAFHIAPFHTSKEHSDDQWMRVLCPLFEKYKVDVVWSGHVHNYQRSYPLTFVPEGGPDEKGRVAGKWTLDQTFDGDKNTKPTAPIYIVTGGGGAPLYDPDIQQKPADWQPFIKKYIADTHSLTQVDVDGSKLSVQQISEDGKALDKFKITK